MAFATSAPRRRHAFRALALALTLSFVAIVRLAAADAPPVTNSPPNVAVTYASPILLSSVLDEDWVLEEVAAEVAAFVREQPGAAVDGRALATRLAQGFASAHVSSDVWAYEWRIVDGEYVPFCFRRTVVEVTDPYLRDEVEVVVVDATPLP